MAQHMFYNCLEFCDEVQIDIDKIYFVNNKETKNLNAEITKRDNEIAPYVSILNGLLNK